MSKNEYGTVRVLCITNDNQVAAISNLYAVSSSAGAELPPVRLVLDDDREVGMSYEIARCLSEIQCRRDKRQRRDRCCESLVLVLFPGVSAVIRRHR